MKKKTDLSSVRDEKKKSFSFKKKENKKKILIFFVDANHLDEYVYSEL
jgi:hypothetical protein